MIGYKCIYNKNYKTGNVGSNEFEIQKNGFLRWGKHGDITRNRVIRGVSVPMAVKKLPPICSIIKQSVVMLQVCVNHQCGHGRGSLQHGDLAARASIPTESHWKLGVFMT